MKAFFQIAQGLQGLAMYELASSAYEQFAANYPNREETREALRLAAIFRKGLGQYSKAIENYEAFARTLGRRDASTRMTAFFEIGDIYARQEQWARVIRHFKRFLRDFRREDPAYRIRAYTLLGNAYANGRRRRDSRRAYNESWSLYQGLSQEQKDGLELAAINAVAEARFKLANAEFNEVKETTFRIRSQRRFNQEFSKQVATLNRKLEAVKQIYEEIVGLNTQNWSLAALTQIGRMYDFFFRKMEEAPVPQSFPYDIQELIRVAYLEKSRPLREKAIETYRLCLQKAQQVQWFNSWTRIAEERLGQISPESFRDTPEVRSAPDQMNQSQIAKGLIVTLEEREEVRP